MISWLRWVNVQDCENFVPSCFAEFCDWSLNAVQKFILSRCHLLLFIGFKVNIQPVSNCLNRHMTIFCANPACRCNWFNCQLSNTGEVSGSYCLILAHRIDHIVLIFIFFPASFLFFFFPSPTFLPSFSLFSLQGSTTLCLSKRIDSI